MARESEHVNSTTAREQTYGYGADPDEFDAYLSRSNSRTAASAFGQRPSRPASAFTRIG